MGIKEGLGSFYLGGFRNLEFIQSLALVLEKYVIQMNLNYSLIFFELYDELKYN
jgi:hypothetical protein